MIFDLGFHKGEDTKLYLKKGFKVVAVEANPFLVMDGNLEFKKYIDEKNLILLHRVVSDRCGIIDFHLHPLKSEWSSCEVWLAERDGVDSTAVPVVTISLIELCLKYGTPHYLKVDVEGCEIAVAKQIFELDNKPQFVSFETSKSTYAELFALLYMAGYKKFQLVNQLNNPEYTSGNFGEFLQEDKWFDYDELLTRYVKYKELKIIDNQELALGWLDVHASL